MREIVLDTETTGLDPADGHRIVEIGAVELINHIPSGRTYHVYINPERDMPSDAEAVHGLSAAFLRDKPVFASIYSELLEFMGDAPLIIHNAAFDLKFINAELSYLRRENLPQERIIDTLTLARLKHPIGPNSLDALCKRYGIDNSKREKHGALLDASLLAEVYLELIGGRQAALVLSAGPAPARVIDSTVVVRIRPHELPLRLTTGEREAHAALVAELGTGALWLAAER
jgi:DNA polymerase-3 subunit epsilon